MNKKMEINKQTAVEWYEQEINLLIKKYQLNEISQREFITMKHNLFYQAKEMEKQQIIDAYEQGDIQLVNGKQYYEQTYGGNNE
jgi:hypothetical protein